VALQALKGSVRAVALEEAERDQAVGVCQPVEPVTVAVDTVGRILDWGCDEHASSVCWRSPTMTVFEAEKEPKSEH
jgi:hypothetical protein